MRVRVHSYLCTHLYLCVYMCVCALVRFGCVCVGEKCVCMCLHTAQKCLRRTNPLVLRCSINKIKPNYLHRPQVSASNDEDL